MKDFDSKGVGLRLGKIRIEKGLSQEQVAAALDISRETYNTIESGRRKLKDYEIVQLAGLFDTTTDYILRDVQSNNVGLSNATGLSDPAITYLQMINKDRNKPLEPIVMPDGAKNARIHQLLNILLSPDGDKLLADIANYVYSDFAHAYPIQGDTLTWEPIDGLGFGTGNDVVSVSVNAIRFGLMKEIETNIDDLREKANAPANNEPKKRVRRAKK